MMLYNFQIPMLYQLNELNGRLRRFDRVKFHILVSIYTKHWIELCVKDWESLLRFWYSFEKCSFLGILPQAGSLSEVDLYVLVSAKRG